MFYLYLIASTIIGYLAGSIPFALIIGKAFYNTDVRVEGSHNLGATNVGRVLGKKAAILVLACDSLKCGLVALATYFLSFLIIGKTDCSSLIYLLTGLGACIGHCYPVFANFKGGKAVATLFGFLICFNYKLLIIFLAIFALVVLTSKIVSISSLSASFGVVISSFIPFIRDNNFYLQDKLSFYIATLILFLISVLLLIRHVPNIKRLLRKEEKQYSFKK